MRAPRGPLLVLALVIAGVAGCGSAPERSDRTYTLAAATCPGATSAVTATLEHGRAHVMMPGSSTASWDVRVERELDAELSHGRSPDRAVLLSCSSPDGLTGSNEIQILSTAGRFLGRMLPSSIQPGASSARFLAGPGRLFAHEDWLQTRVVGWRRADSSCCPSLDADFRWRYTGADGLDAARISPVWRPAPGTSWQWQITGAVDTAVSPAVMFDVDLQDAVPSAQTVTVPGFGSVSWPKGLNAGVVGRLHAAGKVVICYMDSGAWERYRPDAKLFPSSVIGRPTGWSGERWLDIRSSAWSAFAPIVWARMDLARSIGCDGVEPDQNNSVGNDPGFAISLAQQKAWYLQVAMQAHARNLSVGMKNGIETTDADTIEAFDWNLNEECFQYSECGVLNGFIAAGKAVFQTEYATAPASFCPEARSLGFSSLTKKYGLDAWRITC